MKNITLKNAKIIGFLASIIMLTVISITVITTQVAFTANAQTLELYETRRFDRELGMEYTQIISRNGEQMKRDIRFRREFSVDQDFCDQTVIVTLRNAHSTPNNVFGRYDFSTQPIGYSLDGMNVRGTLFVDVEDLTYLTAEGEAFWQETLGEDYDLLNFNQILSLQLRDRGKENVLRAISELEQLDKVLAAEPSFNLEPVVDNTGLWGLDWINTAEARNIATAQGTGIIVGVMEGGVLPHAELGNRLVEGNIATPPNNADNNHGVHVAGTIAGTTTGVAPNASIMPLSWNDFVGSMTHARNNGVRIVNASFRYTETINGVRVAALANAAHANAIQNFPGIFIGSAGNQNWNNDMPRNLNIVDSGTQFPASYRLDNVISVGATRRNRPTIFHNWRIERAAFSNFGANTVDIYAPGQDIRSLIHNNGFANWQGTSMAAPHVAGTATLMLSLNSALTGDQLRNGILDGADNIEIATGAGNQNVRHLNAQGALQNVNLFTFSILGDNVTITGVRPGITLPNRLEIPERINNRTVVAIGHSAFAGNISVMNVHIPSTVTTIGNNAFENTTNLTNITLPAGVTSIGDGAFFGTRSLSSITVASGNPHFETRDGVLYNSALTRVIRAPVSLAGEHIIPGSATRIDAGAFENTGLTIVEIPRSVTYIGDGAFSDSTRLSTVRMQGDPPFLGVNAFFNHAPDLIIYVPNNSFHCYVIAYSWNLYATRLREFQSTHTPGLAFRWCVDLGGYVVSKGVVSQNIQRIIIPSVRNGRPVVAIGEEGFAGINNTAVWLPNSIRYIGYRAFTNSGNLAQVNIPHGVTRIEGMAFAGTPSLTGIEIPASVTHIGYRAFERSGIQNITLRALYIGRYAFYNNQRMTELTILGSVQSIGDGAFASNINLSDITIDYGVREIGARAFRNNRELESITLPDSVRELGRDAFYDCIRLNTVQLSRRLAEIQKHTFFGTTELTEITIPHGVERIAYRAFEGSNFTRITIPESVNFVAWYAFAGTDISLTWIYNPAIRANTFAPHLTEVIIPDTVTTITRQAFSGAVNLTSIIIPSNITRIESYAFENCKGLTSILIPSTVTRIEYDAFYGSDNLTVFAEVQSRPVESQNPWTDPWHEYFNRQNRPVIWGATPSSCGAFVVSFVRTDGSICNPNNYDKSAPAREGYIFAGWSLTPAGPAAFSMYNVTTAPEGTNLFAVWI